MNMNKLLLTTKLHSFKEQHMSGRGAVNPYDISSYAAIPHGGGSLMPHGGGSSISRQSHCGEANSKNHRRC
jgi:hypothetical protein